MKKILFGITLELFSLICMAITALGEMPQFYYIGIVIALCGLLFAIVGFFSEK